MERDERERFIFGTIFFVANKLQAIGDQYLGRGGVTTKQWFLSVVISQFGDRPPSLSEVAELMGSSRQNVKQLALKLEEKGFLTIERDRRDARALRLKLTEKSREFWEQREDIDSKFLEELFEDIDEKELTVLAEGMEKLNRKLEKWNNNESSEEEE